MVQQRIFHPSLLILPVLAFAIGGLVVQRGMQKDAFKQVCNLVSEKFYDPSEALGEWTEECLMFSERVSFWTSRDKLMRLLQDQLNLLGVSHLRIYDPEQDRRMWRGEALDTGLRVRWVNGRALVSEMIPGSSAAQVGLMLGDEIRSVNGQAVTSSWQMESTRGYFAIERENAKDFRVFLEPRLLQIDSSPQIFSLSNKVGWLKLSSFRAEYFNSEAWKALAAQLTPFSQLVVDLRNNSGGNFVAVLRVLSTFLCQPTDVGVLQQPRKMGGSEVVLDDDTNENFQVQMLTAHSVLRLRTYTRYGCYMNPVTVLVDQNTASVAEIFARAMRDRPRSRIWGKATAGDVLVGKWYEMPLLGRGFSLSIPEALFLDSKGESLEGGGVWPQRELQYDFDETRRGQDSWLLRSL